MARPKIDLPPDVAPGGLFPPVPMTVEQRDTAIKEFVGALAAGAKHDAERLWALLGYNVEDRVAKILTDLHEALGVLCGVPAPGAVMFDLPPEVDAVDADGDA